MYFEIVVTCELTIRDLTTATYNGNHNYFYEKTACTVTDANGQMIFIKRFDFNTKSDLIRLVQMFL
ncbi:hypothetical protein BH11BAC4_BH11BAC4_24010 [soil metagenome]